MSTVNEPQSAASDADLDLESQLDALLEQIEQAEPGIVPRASTASAFEPPSPAQTPPPVEDAAPVVDDAAAAVEDPAAETVQSEVAQDEEASLDLASQIQQLLDDARTHQPDASAASTAAAARPASRPEASQPDPLTADDVSADASEITDAAAVDAALQSFDQNDFEPAAPVEESAEPPQAAATRPTTTAQASSRPADPPQDHAMGETLNIDDIDQLLADDADNALAGDFETISEVLATEQLPDIPPQPSRLAGATPAPAAQPAPAAAAPASPEASATPAESQEFEDELEGSFEEPEAVMQSAAESPSSTLSPGAMAVAQELDDQPENRVRASAKQDSQDAPPESTDQPAPARPSAIAAMARTVLAELKTAPELIRSTCEIINRPLVALTPQTRDMIGYIGLITLFWGSVTLVGRIIVMMMK